MELHTDSKSLILVHKPSLTTSASDYFREALAFAKDNYQGTIDRISSRRFEEVDDQMFFEEYVWAVYVSGFRASVIGKLWSQLMDAYQDAFYWASYFGLDKHQPNWDRVKERAMLVFANERKVDAVIKTAGIVREGIKEMEWTMFRNSHLAAPEQLQELPFIGKITRYHLARNIGLLQYVKPDLHLVRMAKHWGSETPQALCDELGKEFGLQAGIVDLVLWYAASTFGTQEIG